MVDFVGIIINTIQINMFGQQTQNPQTNQGQTSLFGGNQPPSPFGGNPQAIQNPNPTGQAAPAAGQNPIGQIGAPPAQQIQSQFNQTQSKVEQKNLILSREKEFEHIVFQSQQGLSKFLMEAIATNNQRKINEFKVKIKERCEQALGFFKLSNPLNQVELDNLIKQLQDKLQWSEFLQIELQSRFKGQQATKTKQISQKLIVYLLQPLCEQLSLEPTRVFEILDSFFCELPNKYHLLAQMDERIFQLENNMHQFMTNMPQIGWQQNPQLNDMKTQHQKYCDHFLQQISEVKHQIILFYLKERAAVIENAKSIILAGQSQVQGFSELLDSISNNGLFLKHLIKSLIRNLSWASFEFKNLDEPLKKIVFGHLQQEQIAMLELVFAIAQNHDLEKGKMDVQMSHVKKFYKYLTLTDFRGYMVNGLDEYRVRELQNLLSSQESIIINESKIKDLGILTMLALLRVDAFQDSNLSQPQKNLANNLYKNNSKDFKKLVDQVKKTDPTALSSIVILSLQQVLATVERCQNMQPGSLLGLSQEVEKQLIQSNFMVEVSNMLNDSFLLTVPGHTQQSRLDQSAQPSIQGEFLKVLKSFLNLIYSPVLMKNQMQEEIEEVKHLIITVLLKNPVILQDVWSILDKKGDQQNDLQGSDMLILRMYEDLLAQPMTKLSVYTYLLRQLCGKNRHRFAKFVFQLMRAQRVKPQGSLADSNEIRSNLNIAEETNSLEQELLSSSLILLYQLQSSQMEEQEKFDTLNNLLVIICKIIKQTPTLYYELNETFYDIIKEKEFKNGAVFASEKFISLSNLSQAVRSLMYDYEIELSEIIMQNPLLVFLVRSLFVFASRLELHNSNEAIKHIMDCISKIFSQSPDLKKSVIDLILLNQSDSFKLSSFFQDMTTNFEVQQNSFKCTVSYLKFIGKILKLEFPYMILNQAQQVNLHESILTEMFKINFSECLSNFFNYRFGSIGHFSKFATRLLKIVYLMMARFDSGNHLCMIDIKQRNPRFDSFLNILFSCLNSHNLRLFIEILEVQEVRGVMPGVQNIRQAFVHNKFIAQILQGTLGSGQNHGYAKQNKANAVQEKQLVNEMIFYDLKCLNQLARLCLQNIQLETFSSQQNKDSVNKQLDTRNVKLYYISNLKAVNDMTQQLCNLNVQENLFMKCNLVSLMAFYGGLESSQRGASNAAQRTYRISENKLLTIQNNTLATEFIRTSALMWQFSVEKRKIDLSLLLTKNGFLLTEDVKRLFMVPVLACLSQLRNQKGMHPGKSSKTSEFMFKYLIQQFELLIFCARSQHGFINHIFLDENHAQDFVREVQSFFKCQGSIEDTYSKGEYTISLASKIISFLAELSRNRLVLPVLQQLTGTAMNQSGNGFLSSVVDSYILPVCAKNCLKVDAVNFQTEKAFVFEDQIPDKDFYLQEKMVDENFAQNETLSEMALEHCQSVLGIAEFLRLLQHLFALNPIENFSLRQLVQELFSDERFVSFFELQSDTQLVKDVNIVFQHMQIANSSFKTMNPAQLEYMGEIQKVVERENLLEQDQVNCNAYNHSLVSFKTSTSEKLSGDGSQGQIYLDNLDTFKVDRGLNFLSKKLGLENSTASIMASWASQKNRAEIAGQAGRQFLINTHDLKQALIQNGFKDINLVNEFCNCCQQFSLGVSVLECHNVLIQAKSDFVLNVGKTKLRQNITSLPKVLSDKKIGSQAMNHSFQMLASLFPLVDKDFPRHGQNSINQSEFKSSIETLINKNLHICKSAFGQLQKEYETLKSQKNYSNHDLTLQLGFKHSQGLFRLLETSLSQLNLCVSPSSISGICQVEDLRPSQSLLTYVSEELLLHFPHVFNFHMNQSLAGSSMKSAEVMLRNKDTTYSALTIQLLIAQIMESITKDKQFDQKTTPKQTEGIVYQLTQVISIMAKLGGQNSTGAISSNNQPIESKKVFKDCLRIFQVSINLMSQETIQNFMNQGINQPLRIIIQRLIGQDSSDVESAIEIVQFLISYAELETGSEYLMRENVLQYLFMNQCMINAKMQDLYMQTADNEETRNPHHILWCQMLLLIRTLASNLLDGSSSSFSGQSQGFLKKLIQFFQTNGITERIQAFLCFQLNNRGQKVTQAVMEENEITLSIVCLLFMSADKVQKISNSFLQGLKDSLLFGLTQIFESLKPSNQPKLTFAASKSEKYLQSISAEYLLEKSGIQGIASDQFKMNLLDLKSQVHLVKSYMSYCAAIMNLILLEKQNFSSNLDQSSNALFPMDWSYLQNYGPSSVASAQDQAFVDLSSQLRQYQDQEGSGFLLKQALDLLIDSQICLNMIWTQWNTPSKKATKVLFDALKNIFGNDEQITKEYFGLNSLFISSGDNQSGQIKGQDEFSEFMELFDTSLEMGEQLQKLLLERIVDFKEEAKQSHLGQHVGISQREVYEFGKAVLVQKQNWL